MPKNAQSGDASMGLRDWVSEMVRRVDGNSRPRSRFNGAPRLGLGDGLRPAAPQPMQANGFNGAPRLGLGDG